METSLVVQYTVEQGCAVLTLDNPPVNALGTALRAGLLQALARAEADPMVGGVLLCGAGKCFTAGADIREFGRPPLSPSLPELCNAVEASSKPVVAALHGAALGGGLELALAAHYRLAAEDARLGLPEVQLGLLPGAGGTQRSPRLVGAAAALTLMLSARPLDAAQALAIGLVDQVVAGPALRAAGLAALQRLVAQGGTPRRSRDAGALAERTAAQAAVDAARAGLYREPGLFAPGKIVDAVQAAIDLPFEDGLRVERALFEQCLASPQRAGLVHAFFAEREVRKAPEIVGIAPRPIERAGVVGGGTMGVGIALALLDAGLKVVMIERDAAALAQAQRRIEQVYDGQVAKERLSAQARAERLARWQGATDYAALAAVDLVIEAVFEDMAVKHAVFAELDRVCRPGAILASNTSYLDLDAIAAPLSRPQEVIGLHFFSPANVMKLLEIVVPARVAPDVVASAFALAQRLNKVPVRAGVCDGFIGNRILAAYRSAADHLLEDGASPYEIDRMARAFGFPMGPYQVSDLAGGDIGWAARKRRAASRDPRARYVHIADRLCERGWFGQKSGRGWYRYPEGTRGGEPDPEVEALIVAERVRAGIVPHHFEAEALQRRYLAAMINEGAKVVGEGIALRPLDVDMVLIHGYGFPRWRGGPMKYADTVGLPRLLADIQTYAQEDPLFWQPAELLLRLVAAGQNFDSLNQAAQTWKPEHA